MHRGSTPTLRFKFDRDISNLDYLSIAFSQHDTVILEKRRENCRIDKDIIGVYLSEDETLKFETADGINAYVDVQVKIGYENKRVISEIMQVIIKPILKDGRLNTEPYESIVAVPVFEYTRGDKKIRAVNKQEPGTIEQYTETTASIDAHDLDPYLLPGNIRKGAQIFGVNGTVETGGSSGNVEPVKKDVMIEENGPFVIDPTPGYDSMGRVEGTINVKTNVGKKPQPITKNGNYQAKTEGLTGYTEVEVDVQPELESLNIKEPITQNGKQHFEASPGYYGLKKVDIDVQVPEKDIRPYVVRIPIVENGVHEYNASEIDADGLSSVSFEVKVAGEKQRIEPYPEKPVINENNTVTTFTAQEVNLDGISSIDVEVAVPEKRIGEYNPMPTIENNGLHTYKASEVGLDGIGQITVDVRVPEKDIRPYTKEAPITKNGSYTVKAADIKADGLSSVEFTVEVPAPAPVLQTPPEITENTPNGPINLEPGYQGFSGPINVNVTKKRIQELKEETIKTPVAEITPDAEYDGMKKVRVTAPLQPKKVFDRNGVYKPEEGNLGFAEIEVKCDAAILVDEVLAKKRINYTMANQITNLRGTPAQHILPLASFYFDTLNIDNVQPYTDYLPLPFFGIDAKNITVKEPKTLKLDLEGSKADQIDIECSDLVLLECGKYSEIDKINISINSENPQVERIGTSAIKPTKVKIQSSKALTIKDMEINDEIGFAYGGVQNFDFNNIKEIGRLYGSSSSGYSPGSTLINRSPVKTTLLEPPASAKTKINVYVPDTLVSEYKADPNWNKFPIKAISELPPEK